MVHHAWTHWIQHSDRLWSSYRTRIHQLSGWHDFRMTHLAVKRPHWYVYCDFAELCVDHDWRPRHHHDIVLRVWRRMYHGCVLWWNSCDDDKRFRVDGNHLKFDCLGISCHCDISCLATNTLADGSKGLQASRKWLIFFDSSPHYRRVANSKRFSVTPAI